MYLQIFVSIVSIGVIVMGSVHWKHCPNTPGLPITLILSGILFNLTSFVCFIKERLSKQDNFVGTRKWKILKVLEFIGIILLVVSWIIWLDFVFTTHHPTFDDPGKDDYCEKLFFNFATFLLPLLVFFGQIIFLLLKYRCWEVNRDTTESGERRPLISAYEPDSF